jgi:hypothetical protein
VDRAAHERALHDRRALGRSYHNATVSFTRRYFDRISNSVRLIINAGQDLPRGERTADGGLLIVESSLVTPRPLTVEVPSAPKPRYRSSEGGIAIMGSS